MSTPPTAAAKKTMTVDEFWDFVNLPENRERRFELIRGEVAEMSRPTRPHGAVVFNVGFELGLYVRRTGRGYLVTESGLVLEEDPGTVVGPDVAYYLDADKFGDLHPKWGDVPPILVAEVQSPNDRPNALIAKISDYLRNGVRVVWLVDYEDRTVSVHRPNVNPTVFRADQELTGGDDLPEFVCRVSDFFKLPGDRPTATPPQAPPPPAAS
jgi:Uma2 family endonuclease